MFQKLYKFKNTLSKNVVLKYFCWRTCLISFSRQIRVSIKNYQISVRIKYSVHDLIYESISVQKPQWRNKRKMKQMTSAFCEDVSAIRELDHIHRDINLSEFNCWCNHVSNMSSAWFVVFVFSRRQIARVKAIKRNPTVGAESLRNPDVLLIML